MNIAACRRRRKDLGKRPGISGYKLRAVYNPGPGNSDVDPELTGIRSRKGFGSSFCNSVSPEGAGKVNNSGALLACGPVFILAVYGIAGNEEDNRNFRLSAAPLSRLHIFSQNCQDIVEAKEVVPQNFHWLFKSRPRIGGGRAVHDEIKSVGGHGLADDDGIGDIEDLHGLHAFAAKPFVQKLGIPAGGSDKSPGLGQGVRKNRSDHSGGPKHQDFLAGKGAEVSGALKRPGPILLCHVFHRFLLVGGNFLLIRFYISTPENILYSSRVLALLR